MELLQGATPICEGSCRLTFLERQEVWNDCMSCKVRISSNGNLLWEGDVIAMVGRKVGYNWNEGLRNVHDVVTAMPFGLSRMHQRNHGEKEQGGVRVTREDDRGVTKGREDVREVFQQRRSRAKRKANQDVKESNVSSTEPLDDDTAARLVTRSANPLALLAAAQPNSDNYYEAPVPQRSNAPSYKQSSSTRSTATTRHKGSVGIKGQSQLRCRNQLGSPDSAKDWNTCFNARDLTLCQECQEAKAGLKTNTRSQGEDSDIPYDTSDPANRFAPDGEEIVTLSEESRSKLDKDKVKPYNYTHQNSLYETFIPPSKTYLDQLERFKEIRKTMWRKTFVRTKPNIAKNIGFLPMSKSISKNHDACVSRYLKDVNARTKKPKVVPISASKPKRKANKSVATPHKKTVAPDTTIQKSKSYFKELYENTNQEWKWWIAKRCPSSFTWTQKPLRTKQIWTPKIRKANESTSISPTIDIVSRITNVLKISNSLGSNLSNVPSSANSLSRLDLQGNDLLTGNRGSDLYTISIFKKQLHQLQSVHAKSFTTKLVMASKAFSIVLRLHHLTLKARKKNAKHATHGLVWSNVELQASKERSISVIVDDYSRYTWTLFLRSKDETPETDGTEFLNKTIHAYFKEEGIEHQTSTPRTPEQNGVVERRNRTLVEAARTMLSASKASIIILGRSTKGVMLSKRVLILKNHLPPVARFGTVRKYLCQNSITRSPLSIYQDGRETHFNMVTEGGGFMLLQPEGSLIQIIQKKSTSKKALYGKSKLQDLGEVLNDLPRFVGILIAEFATGCTVNLTLKVKGDMIIKKLNSKPTIDAMMRDFLDPSQWKELSKETSSKILPCGDESYWTTPDGVGSKRYHIVPFEELNGVPVALVAGFGVISKSTDRIFVSHRVLMVERGKDQRPIYFGNRVLQGAELNYPIMEKLVLAFIHAARKLKRYFQAHNITVLTNKAIRLLLLKHEKLKRIARWAIELGEHEIEFKPRNSVKFQIHADFLAETKKEDEETDFQEKQLEGQNTRWKLYTDGASSGDGSEAGLMIVNPEGIEFTYALKFKFTSPNNEAGYEVVIAALRIIKR
ncbi:retrovirus-related pol polyprotein from transposon TNT 1-94 [Tanacetum coccineum]